MSTSLAPAIPDTEPWLTVEDVMPIWRLRDPRSARKEIERRGGQLVAGRWLLPPDRLRINLGADQDRADTSSLTGDPPSTSDPQDSVPDTLEPGWLDEEE